MVDQIGTGNPADELIGDDRPPSRRPSALLVVLVLVLGGLAVSRILDSHPAPQAAPADASPSATSAPRRPRSQVALPTPYLSAYPASAAPTPLVPPPWAGVPVRGAPQVDYAVGDRVHWLGQVFRLRPGDQVVAMERAARGPVVVVQSSGSTVLEQLRTGGEPLVLDTFHDESRHLQGLAVDPSGTRVAYALTSSSAHGPFGLVVRDLHAGGLLASRGTGLSYAVRDWPASGVLLEAVDDRPHAPFVWRPGRGAPVSVTSPARGRPGGPALLAASPSRARWAVRMTDCTEVVRRDGRAGTCLPPLEAPAAWSPQDTRVAGRTPDSALAVLDTASGSITRVVSLGRLFLGQVVWQDDGSLLLAVHTLADHRGAVLLCTEADGCARARLGAAARSTDLVLAE